MSIVLYTGFSTYVPNPKYKFLGSEPAQLSVWQTIELDLGAEFPKVVVYEKFNTFGCHVVVDGVHLRILRRFGFNIPANAVEWNFEGYEIVRNLKSNWEVLRKEWTQ